MDMYRLLKQVAAGVNVYDGDHIVAPTADGFATLWDVQSAYIVGGLLKFVAGDSPNGGRRRSHSIGVDVKVDVLTKH